ncbi:MAG TPA: DNA methyltransferase [Cyclobacteriaceae bacterium]|nr:DNA methyltransferase [Cyclobacteriaceae bacterium]
MGIDWNFTNTGTRHSSHSFHTYPAMLVPQIAEELIKEYGKKSKLLFDPFCGTGTTLVEANIKGINAIGTDLNPLARLISKVKTTVIRQQTIDLYLKDFYDHLFNYRYGFLKKDSVTLPKFSNINFWFSRTVTSDLAVIKAYIDNLKEESIKDFFKVAFSQTIRDTSWTRKNEFKLYKMDSEKIKTFKPDVFSIFENTLARNRSGLIEFAAKKMNNAWSKVSEFDTTHPITSKFAKPNSVDIVVTSPPYGDSQTTVAYGQFSRLTNQWLGNFEAYNLDSQLMGGKKAPEIIKFTNQSLNNCITRLSQIDHSRCRDVVSFYKDYQNSIENVAKVVKHRGTVCYVVSNRCVKGITLKTDSITRSFFERSGFKHVETIERKISNKRMPRKNSPNGVTGETKNLMNKEYIVVMRKK